ncbi:MAG: rRNA maturation RNase YbeY [Paludibacter sp.]|nr:rRNA maturation RNase YbeY [Bacteroidales bacterium]MCM1069565.1 rRNA maturation RNase YbeY [Prevotella sp.]MCM1354211.1 rRNA maturation RNase YbeY [Bacteroides sp.]MCM1443050.1 rRNA maturation RNase YbeY [Muribaculum sp.]MCM1482285.1 rRNA maturation RNase YbeY [Paludibacter sp.]
MIRFTTAQTEMPVLHEAAVRAWIGRVAAYYKKHVGDITYIFCNDDHILEVNRQFLNHDYYTDVITFDYSEDNLIAGDIFISLDTVRSNARQVGCSYEDELLRIVIHGVLHLTGQADKTPETRAEMTRKEELALSMRPSSLRH